MEILLVFFVIGGTFALCYLFDKGFTKLFRNTAQHKTGRAVKLSKRYGSIGLVFVALGIGASFASIGKGAMLLVCGLVLIVVGIGLITAFLSFGIYYDEDSFLISAFGKRNRTYRFAEIRSQQLYNANGNIVIELHMIDETAIQLHSFMEGTDTFLNAAFYAWCRQKNIDPDACGFHDPGNSCWFPNAEG